MGAEENKAVVRRYVEEGFNPADTVVLDEVFAPGFVNHDTGNPAIRDLDGLKAAVNSFHLAFPDIRATIDALFTDGDCVTKLFTLSGTQQGEFNGIPPTGKQFTVQGIDVARVTGGKIQEIWMGIDYLTVLQQLGAIPEPEQAAV